MRNISHKNKTETPEERIVRFIDYLKDSGMIRFKKQLYDATGIRRQHYTAARDGRIRFTTTQIKAICENYPLNANWVFGVDDKMIRH